MALNGHDDIWAIHCDDFASLPQRLQAMQQASPRGGVRAASTHASVAVVPITGVLSKSGNWWTSEGSTVSIRNAINAAVADPNVAAILLHVDSPGGSVMGAKDAADAIAAAGKIKPVVSFIEDYAASGAIWLASQARKVYANQPTAMVGSIGTYAVLYDMSGMAAKDGIKVHVIRAGQHKGAGTPGTEITPDQLAMQQRMVDALNESFLQAVATGRGMSIDAVRAIATGELFLAPRALELGLIDGIKSLDAVVGELVAASKPQQKPAVRGVRMSEQTEGPKAATITEIKAACPGAPADWVLAQLEAGATLSAAQTAFIAHQSAEIAKAKKEAEERVKAAAPLKQPGYAPVRREATASSKADDESPQASGDPKADFAAAVNAVMEKRGCTRRQAAAVVAARDPVLHRAYLLATNSRAVHGLVEERFAQSGV